MALRYLAGGRVEGLSGDTKPTTSQSGSVFYETDTNKTYDLISGTWTERSINLYRSGANQGTIDTTATDDLYTVGHVDVNGTGTLDVQSGGVIHVGADPLPAVDTLISDVDSLTSDVALKASIASPTFTGTVVLPNVPAIVTTQLDLKAPLNSPTLTTPALGTPSAGVLTNCTGLVATTGLTATGTKSSGTFLRGDDTWGAVTTYSAPTIGSTSIASGATVTTIAGLTLTSPTLTTPALGTPASGVLTNCTGLPLAGLATSAKTEALIFAVSDETSDIETGTSKGVSRMPSSA